MAELNLQAEGLNKTIKSCSPAVYELLSKKGRAIFFPAKGILAQTAEAKGREINATIGMALEDDKSPLRLSTIARHIKLDPAEAFPYAPSFGKPELRKKWKEMIYKKNPSLAGKQISLPIVTNALTHGLSMLGYMFVDEGDKIILPDLFWGNYKLIFINAYGAQLNTFPFFKEGKLDVLSFENKISEGKVGKKIVLLNFPNNPSGYTPTDQEAGQIRDVLKAAAEAGNKIVVFIDDAYFGLVYEEGIYKESLFAELADLHENLLAIKVDGATKEDYVWGFRTGFLTYGIKNASKEPYSALEAKTAGAVRGNISNAPHLSQSLVLKSLDSPDYDAEKKQKYELLKKRFEIVKGILQKHQEYAECFEALPFNSGYFMCVRLKALKAEDVRQTLLAKYSTGVIAIGDILRIAFSSTPTDKLEKLFANIYNACHEHCS
ncbi:MAG: aminotransferase class I/II-fold pyridoxal phosphate-dependent enzyme [Planctomycetota bacterium]|jgi:aspartate/methionine/tyrosine aminotransferase